MKVSGFTFIKDAVKYAFPVVESIESILPICDEFIVNVGISDDGTIRLIKTINDPKIEIIESRWDPSLRAGGRILAQQTNIALARCRGDWCFYLQADEVVHERDLPQIRRKMEESLDDTEVEGLLFNYYHFYRSYSAYLAHYHWYRQEVRIIRRGRRIQSWGDAQGFRREGKKLRVRHSEAHVYHYGWVRPPEIMQEKNKHQDSLYHNDDWVKRKYQNLKDKYDYLDQIDPKLLKEFTGSHPRVVQNRVRSQHWKFDLDKIKHKVTLRDLRYRIGGIIARLTGLRIGEYKNFIFLK